MIHLHLDRAQLAQAWPYGADRKEASPFIFPESLFLAALVSIGYKARDVSS